MRSMHGNSKTSAWCHINSNAMRALSCMDARRDETLRPNNSITDIRCKAQSVHGFLESTSCKSAARAKHAPDHKPALQHLFSSQHCAQSYQVLFSGKLIKKSQSKCWHPGNLTCTVVEVRRFRHRSCGTDQLSLHSSATHGKSQGTIADLLAT